jgi:hypothetical protein
MEIKLGYSSHNGLEQSWLRGDTDLTLQTVLDLGYLLVFYTWTQPDCQEKGMVFTGQFREDPWSRSNAFPINIPPLRQQVIDIPALVSYVLEQKSMDLKVRKVPSLAPERRIMGQYGG